MNRLLQVSIIAAVVAAFVLAPGTLFAGPAASKPADIRVSNLTSLSFTVSWVTPDMADGEVRFGPTTGLGRVKKDMRGDGYQGRLHYVVLTSQDGLTPDTTFYFDVASGGDVDDNGGGHHMTRTAPVPDLPSVPESVVGTLRDVDGKGVQEAIVYATLIDGDGQDSSGESTLLSYLVRPNNDETLRGSFLLVYGNALEKANLRRSFRYKPQQDKIRYEGVGPSSTTGPILAPLEIGFAQVRLTLPATPTPSAGAAEPPTATPPATSTPTTVPATPTPTSSSPSPTPPPTQPAPASSPTVAGGASPTAAPTTDTRPAGTPQATTSPAAQPTRAGASPTIGVAPAGQTPPPTATAAMPQAPATPPAAATQRGTPAVAVQATQPSAQTATVAGRTTPLAATATRPPSTPTTAPSPAAPTATPTPPPAQPAPSGSSLGWVPIVLFGIVLTGAVGVFGYLARRMQ